MVNGLPARKFGCQGLAEKGISNLTSKWRGHYVPICTQTVSTNGQRCVRVVRGVLEVYYVSVFLVLTIISIAKKWTHRTTFTIQNDATTILTDGEIQNGVDHRW